MAGAEHCRLPLCWRHLFSRFVSKQVSSAHVSLTSVFGMGTGGPSRQSTPTAESAKAGTLKTEQSNLEQEGKRLHKMVFARTLASKVKPSAY